MILKAILIEYYNKPRKIQLLFHKIKPELILFKMIKTYNDSNLIDLFKKNLKKNINDLGFTSNYIVKFFKYLNLKCLDITYYNKTFLLNFDEVISIIVKNGYIDFTLNKEKINYKNLIDKTTKILNDIPDIIVLYHQELNKFMAENNYKNYLKLNERDKQIFDASKGQYNFNISGAGIYNENIYLNGYAYKLDAVLLDNYNVKDINHSIAGITCNNNHYVYNGWNKQSIDPAMNIQDIQNVNPCSLMKYDWNLRKDDEFCLNPINCQLHFLKPNEKQSLCFSFAKGYRTLIYVRTNIYKENISKPTINKKINFSDASDIIKDMHDIKNLTYTDILYHLGKFNIKLSRNYAYTRDTLETLLKNALKKHYNINSKYISSSLSQPKENQKISPPKENPKLTDTNYEPVVFTPHKDFKSNEIINPPIPYAIFPSYKKDKGNSKDKKLKKYSKSLNSIIKIPINKTFKFKIV